jgi:hypothetical protein
MVIHRSIRPDEFSCGRGEQKDRVLARDLLCYWTSVELGMSMLDLARRFDITPAAVSYAVQREEKMARQRGVTNRQLGLFEY